MNERIKQIRISMNKNQAQFAELLGVAVTNIQSYETGRRSPSTAFIQLLCNKLGVNEKWLTDGIGEMFKPMDRETEMAKLIADLYHENDSFKEELCKLIVSMTPDQIETLKMIARKILKENHPEQ